MQAGYATMAARFDEIFANFPNRPVGWLLRFMVLPLGPRHRGPADHVTAACANLLLEPSATRDRLCTGLYEPKDGAIAELDRAFRLVTATQAARDVMRKSRVHDVAEARKRGMISDSEAAQIEAAMKAVAEVIAVDDFAPEELAPRAETGDVPSPALHRQANAAE
jgi:acyl-CoA dehydrogenase